MSAGAQRSGRIDPDPTGRAAEIDQAAERAGEEAFEPALPLYNGNESGVEPPRSDIHPGEEPRLRR